MKAVSGKEKKDKVKKKSSSEECYYDWLERNEKKVYKAWVSRNL